VRYKEVMDPRPREPKFRCVLHGSFRRHFEEIRRVRRIFTEAGIEVLAPADAEVRGMENGFALLATDDAADPRLIELLYLHNLKKLGPQGFSYFVDPEGYIGRSASYELGIAHLSNTPCFFSERPADHPAYVHPNAVWSPELLAEYIREHRALPAPKVKKNERMIHKLWRDLVVPGSVVAVGGIIEYAGPDARPERDVLLVRTHKWGGRYSIVGGKVKRNERLTDALIREIREETGLRAAVGRHLCTFDEIKDSGYYRAHVQHIFVDKVAEVGSRKVRLNDEAQAYLWMPARAALRDLDLEPNARLTLELYANAAQT
jgi:ADP-ribose pyrophosphatase YjhB (NUDIX family)